MFKSEASMSRMFSKIVETTGTLYESLRSSSILGNLNVRVGAVSSPKLEWNDLDSFGWGEGDESLAFSMLPLIFLY